ncbi:MAG: helix-turn-helix domain-containing protein [Candidatus Dojkabacteria bacterium]|nr:helix-turn-helix domain-containing protein [Candidatus Dojkabacteria bacterium]
MKRLDNLLQNLGLNDEEVKIYDLLLETGLATVINISKRTGISRTNVYRTCEKLEGEGFLSKEFVSGILNYKISSIKFLEDRVQHKIKIVDRLEKMYDVIEGTLESFSSLGRKRIKVIHYSSDEEIKQLAWNVLSCRAKKVMGYGHKVLLWDEEWENFWKKWWDEFLARGISDRQILNPSSIEPVVEYSKEVKAKAEGDRYSKNRIIDEKILKINFETYIYDDVYAQIQWEKDYVFGLEIYNKVVADQERELFNFFWKKAKLLGK